MTEESKVSKKTESKTAESKVKEKPEKKAEQNLTDKSKKLIIIVTSIIIAAAAVLGVVLYFSLNKKPEPEPSAVALKAEMVTLEYDSAVYNRGELTPTVSVVVDGTKLSATEYIVSYSNNINVGTAKVSVSAKQDSRVITGSVEKTFEIKKATIGEIKGLESVAYSGADQSPMIYIEGIHLNTDFVVSWEYKALGADDSTYVALDKQVNNFKQVGEYRVKATGQGNYEGTQTGVYVIYNVMANILFETPKVVGYTGVSQVPTIKVGELVEGQDYTVSWMFKASHETEDSYYREYVLDEDASKNFVDAGTYKVIVQGLGIYGGTKTDTFVIEALDVAEPVFAGTGTYSGYTQNPVYEVSTLIKDKDYITSWKFRTFGGEYADYVLDEDSGKNFINAGEYQLTVKGINNYKGEEVAVFTIEKGEFFSTVDRESYKYNYNTDAISVDGNVSGGAVSYIYTAVAADKENPEAASWKPYTTDLIINAGTYYVCAVIAETDNYNECYSHYDEFVVSRDEMTGLSDFVDAVYDGTSKKQTIEIFSSTGVKLQENVDYQINWLYRTSMTDGEIPYDVSGNFVEAGVYTAYLYAIGNYTEGAITTPTTAMFTIQKAEWAEDVSLTNINLREGDPLNIRIYADVPDGYEGAFEEYVEDNGGTIKYYYNTGSMDYDSVDPAWVEFDPTNKDFTIGTYFIYIEVSGNLNINNIRSNVVYLSVTTTGA